jgi:hypothetical protein
MHFKLNVCPSESGLKSNIDMTQQWFIKGVVILCWISMALPGSAQIELESKKSMKLELRPVISPPQLELDPADFLFVDDNGNGMLDANERASLVFTVTNAPTAMGDAKELKCEVALNGTSQGVSVPDVIRMADIPIGRSLEYTIPLTTDNRTRDGELELVLKVREPYLGGPQAQTIKFQTRAYRKPMLRVVDHRIQEGEIKRGEVFTYQFLMRNKGEGYAYDVRAELNLPDDMVQPVSKSSFKFDMLEPGEVKELAVQVIVPPAFPHDEVQFKVQLHEDEGRHGETFLGAIGIDQSLDDVVWDVPTVSQGNNGGSGPAFLGSDVDRGIPDLKKTNTNRFALVIGNGDYTSSNPGLTQAQNVPFAEADAEAMKRYLQGVWGIPEENIILSFNAKKVEMQRDLSRLSSFAAAWKGEAELVFYYSGHGLPSESTDEPYLIPVDVNGDHPELGLSLESVLDALESESTLRTTVILDACFSGGARNGSLIAGTKGIARVPDPVETRGRTVVFSSSSGNQSSGVYEDQEHGYFTYFLLKAMKESKGKLSYGDWFDDVQQQVMLQTTRDGKAQSPSFRSSPLVEEEWRNWKIND